MVRCCLEFTSKLSSRRASIGVAAISMELNASRSSPRYDLLHNNKAYLHGLHVICLKHIIFCFCSQVLVGLRFEPAARLCVLEFKSAGMEDDLPRRSSPSIPLPRTLPTLSLDSGKRSAGRIAISTVSAAAAVVDGLGNSFCAPAMPAISVGTSPAAGDWLVQACHAPFPCNINLSSLCPVLAQCMIQTCVRWYPALHLP